ncbi:hypothetical protein [Streptomyces sp. N35]|uniref:hypothetical protein n=1 Tax=Streptomyces sp. N35 TaxID=2795730 RepID=UPI0018F69505|nr:hypothetical protein [Streptomyces sp. N35]
MRAGSRRYGPAVAVALSLAAAGCAAEPSQQPTVRTDKGSSQCTGPRAAESTDAEEAAEIAVAHVDTVARQRFAHVYTGLRVDRESLALDLYRIPDAAFDRSACRGIPSNVTVRLHDTTASRTALDALVARISDDIPRWKGEFDLRTIAAAEEGHVEVGVDKPEVAEPLLRKAYGDLVKATYEERPQLRRS